MNVLFGEKKNCIPSLSGCVLGLCSSAVYLDMENSI